MLCKDGNEVNTKPIEYALSVVGGKWKMIIMFWLSKRDIMRYSELKRSIEGITHKMLSAQLKELEADGVVIRKEYQQIPPKVEYSLSEKGHLLMPCLSELCKWGGCHMEDE